MNIAIMSVVMKGFLEELDVELNHDTTEENFNVMYDLATDFENNEILEFLKYIEDKNLKETFFRPQKQEDVDNSFRCRQCCNCERLLVEEDPLGMEMEGCEHAVFHDMPNNLSNELTNWLFSQAKSNECLIYKKREKK